MHASMHRIRNIGYIIYRLGGPDRKICCQSLKNDIFETETKYFSIWTDLNGKYRPASFLIHIKFKHGKLDLRSVVFVYNYD